MYRRVHIGNQAARNSILNSANLAWKLEMKERRYRSTDLINWLIICRWRSNVQNWLKCSCRHPGERMSILHLKWLLLLTASWLGILATLCKLLMSYPVHLISFLFVGMEIAYIEPSLRGSDEIKFYTIVFWDLKLSNRWRMRSPVSPSVSSR